MVKDESEQIESVTEVHRIRIGQRMKWAPMLGYEVVDRETGVDISLMSDGSIRWTPEPEESNEGSA